MFPQDIEASYDYFHDINDPTPDKYDGSNPDSHGTKCAGVIGMVKSNGYCGVGVAYESNIGGMKNCTIISGNKFIIKYYH